MTDRPSLPDERVRNIRCDSIASTVDLGDGSTVAVLPLVPSA